MILLHRLRACNFKQLAEVSISFPPQGTVLIEGENEAGKSCLFEAVFFALYGKTLITDRDYRLEHLKSYGAEQVEVELGFSIEGQEFSILRRIRSQHRAELSCPSRDGGRERITILSEVERRLKQELRVSADALLNSCFVEQKRLERLEDLDRKARAETINDLLNLPLLTNLAREFALTSEDQAAIAQQRQRVQIAEMDAALPGLEQAEQEALRCLRLTRLRDLQERRTILETEAAGGRERQEAVAARRAKIAAAREQFAALRQRQTALETDLAHQARALAGEESRLAAGVETAAELEAVAGGLPARRESLASGQALRERLQELEALRTDGQALRSKREDLERQQERQAALQAECHAAEARRLAAQRDREARESEASAAAADLRRHQVDRERAAPLAAFRQSAQGCSRARDEAGRLAAELDEVREAAARVAALREAVAAQDSRDALEREREANCRELDAVRAELARATERREESRTRAERREALQLEAARGRSRLSESEAALETAAAAAHAVREREALLEWAAAAERAAEPDRAVELAGDLERRAQETEAHLEAAGAAARQAARARTPGWIAGGLGLLAALGAPFAGWFLPLGVAAVLLTAAALLLSRAAGAGRAAAAALGQARSHRDSLEGERRGLQARSPGAAADRQQVLDREARCRRALEDLGVALPESPADARARGAGAPAPGDPAPDVALREAESACQDARIALRVAQDRLEHELGLELPDPTALAEQIDALEARRGELESAIAAAPAGGPVPPEPSPPLRQQLAAAEAAAGRLPGLQDRLAELQRHHDTEAAGLREAAARLGLAGSEPDDWLAAAAREEEELQPRVSRETGDELEKHDAAARVAHDLAGRELAALDAQQERRTAELATLQALKLPEAIAAAETALAENRAAQADREPVVAELERASLPGESADLKTALTLLRAELERDAARAAGLPAAREQVAAREAEVARLRRKLEQDWARQMPSEEPPPATADLQARLAELARQAAAAAAAMDDAALQAEDLRLQREETHLTAALARAAHELERIAPDEARLRSELGLEGGMEAAALLAREPAGAAGDGDAAFWEQRHGERQSELRDRRAARVARAQPAGVGQEPLDLEEERAALAAAEQELDVKRRGVEIVRRTRESIVNKVMPLTMQNVRQLLPLLTVGRYQDARWDEASNLIEVYDTRARSYQRKRVFSGGARDQISLALRLAFALATLPGEHQVRPGWLFLDEPLSSFDRRRTQALVDLVTSGLIRRQFRQIFLISHSEALDPGQFDYRLRLEDGRIAESRLPPGPEDLPFR